MSPPELSIVIPAYNEERRLGPTLDGWLAHLTERGLAAEVIVADDGSTDGTGALARAAAARDPRVRLVTLPANRGKGGAVKAGMLSARGRFAFYVDADMNIAPVNLDRALDLLRDGADLVAARRSLAGYAREERSLGRLVAGALVQVLRRALVLTWIADTQAGFKGFRAGLAEDVFRRARIRSFAFDIEVLYLARRRGARIVALPVEVEFRPDSTYSLRRHLPRFLRDIVAIRVNALRGRYRG